MSTAVPLAADAPEPARMLASVLLLGGISQRVPAPWLRAAMVGVALLMCAMGPLFNMVIHQIQ